MHGDSVPYFEIFGVQYFIKQIKKVIGNKSIKANIYKIQANDSIMCGCFCIGFIDFMLKGENLLDFTNLCSPKEYKKNNKIILDYFE